MSGDVGTLELTFVTASACHLCDHGRRVLAQLADSRHIRVREVDLTTVEGRQLAARSRAPFPPMVFLGDHLVAHGRLSAGALGRTLDRMSTMRIGG